MASAGNKCASNDDDDDDNEYVVQVDEDEEFDVEDCSVQRTQRADCTRVGSTAVVECETSPTFDPDAHFRYEAPSTSKACDDSLPDVYCAVIDPSTRSTSARDEPPSASGVETNV